MYKFIVLLVSVGFCCGNVPDIGAIIDKADTIYNEKVVEGVVSDRQSRGMKWSTINDLWSCGADLRCWIGRAEKVLEIKRTQLLGMAISVMKRRSVLIVTVLWFACTHDAHCSAENTV